MEGSFIKWMTVQRNHGPKIRRDPGQGQSPIGTSQDLDQFRDFGALLFRIAAGNGVFDAMAYVILQDQFLDPTQGCADRSDLRHNVDAVAILLDHAGEAAHLTLDAVEALQTVAFRILLHA
jgi:hypothetical protein